MPSPPLKKRKTEHQTALKLSTRSKTRLTLPQRPIYFSWETPLILSSYTNLIFYSILTIATLSLLYLGLRAIQLEIHHRIAHDMLDLQDNIAQCTKQYQENQCYDRVTSPILRAYCEDWLNTCMQKNPHVIKRTDIAARVFGELVNSFFDTLTLKTMFALCMLVFGSVLVSFTL